MCIGNEVFATKVVNRLICDKWSRYKGDNMTQMKQFTEVVSGGEEIPAGGWREEVLIESDNYRTKDGEAYFAFTFFLEDEFVEIDTIFLPDGVNIQDDESLCIPSKRAGLTAVTEQKARDFFTARLIAGSWAEKVWANRYPND